MKYNNKHKIIYSQSGSITIARFGAKFRFVTKLTTLISLPLVQKCNAEISSTKLHLCP